MLIELQLAARYLKPRRNAVSLISLTSIIGVTLGVLVLIVVMAVMTGFTNELKKKLIETQAHFQIKNYFGILYPRQITEIHRLTDKHNLEMVPVIQGGVLIQYGTDKRRLDTNTVLFAADAGALEKHLHLKNYLVNGELRLGRIWGEGRARNAVISLDMATRWNLQVGDTFLIHSAKHLTSLVKFNANGGVTLNEESSAYLPSEFKVAGIYSIGKSDFDRMVLFAAPDDASELFDLPWGGATSLYGWGPDAFNQQKLLDELQRQLSGHCRVTGWEEANKNFLDVLAMEKLMMFFLLIFIVLVAAFSITNTLITSVHQKTREIGVLKAIGFSNWMVMRIFLLQGFWVGFIGSITGTLTGFLIIKYRNHILRAASHLAGHDLFPKAYYFFSELPAEIVTIDVIFIVLCSIVLCTIGAVLPALRAAGLSPAEALRYE